MPTNVVDWVTPFLPMFLLTLLASHRPKAAPLRKSERRLAVERRWALRRQQESQARLNARQLTYQKCLTPSSPLTA